MTPAVDQARQAKIGFTLHEYEHASGGDSWGVEAARKTGVPQARVFKTLVVALTPGELAVAVVPVDQMLNLKLMAKASGAKKAVMAEPAEVERATGYVLGGVSPLGQKKRLPTVVHASAEQFATIFVSGGRRGLEIELHPADLARLTRAKLAPLCR